jgi:ADP-heptose:LPS heptosyltransferase
MATVQKTPGYYFRAIFEKAGRKLHPRYKRKWVTLFRYTSALGDALLLSSLAREVKKRNPKAIIHVITGLPEVFDRNPDVDLVTKYNGNPVPGLGKFLIRYEHRFPWKQHLINESARCVDIFDSAELKTYFYPSPHDIEWAEHIVRNVKLPVILINRVAGPRTDKKNWPENYWRVLVNELVKNFTVIEIGLQSPAPDGIPATNYIDLTGKTTLHQTAALMSKSILLICPVTGVLHLAASVNLQVLCILGGSEPAVATKYPGTHYIENLPACANCYEKGPCTNDFLCLTSILPETVLLKVRELTGK